MFTDRTGQVWTGVELEDDGDICLCLAAIPDDQGREWRRKLVWVNLEDGHTFVQTVYEHTDLDAAEDRHRVV